MPKRSAKRPVRALLRHRFRISKGDWIRIEVAVGCALTKVARKELLETTNNFVSFARAEDEAVPTKKVRKRISLLENKASALLSVTLAKGDAALLAHDLIEQSLDSDLAKIQGSLIALRAACDGAVEKLESMAGHLQGDAWAEWIREITRAAKKHNLPTAVRKDVDKQKNPDVPSFVRLVQALQMCIPRRYRRHLHSLGALAKAITVARRSGRDG